MNQIMASPNPVVELLAGTVGLVVIIFVHGAGTRLTNRRFNRAWVGIGADTPAWRVDLTLATAIASLAVLHLLETMLWAFPIWLMGLIPQLRDSYYFVLESYTTLGEGSSLLPQPWRLLGPLIAMSGLFTFGWTASVLVNIMGEFGSLDRHRARSEQAEREDGPADPTDPPGNPPSGT